MFVIKSNVTESSELRTTIEKAHFFFSDGNNYAELMPNVDSIHKDIRGVTRWNISVAVPLVGSWKMSFAVDFLATDDTIEWYPSSTEKQNFLRCVAQFNEKSDGIIQVIITNNLELRRQQAKDFHVFAGMAGERTISQEMQAEVSKMIKDFLLKAKEKLEK